MLAELADHCARIRAAGPAGSAVHVLRALAMDVLVTMEPASAPVDGVVMGVGVNVSVNVDEVRGRPLTMESHGVGTPEREVQVATVWSRVERSIQDLARELGAVRADILAGGGHARRCSCVLASFGHRYLSAARPPVAERATPDASG